MTMGTSESVRRYSQRVKALIWKLTTDIAPSVQVEWYVAGFPEEMGFQIRQTRLATLQQAMEAAQNYENSAQSLQKSLRGSEKREKSKTRRKDRRPGKGVSIPIHPVLLAQLVQAGSVLLRTVRIAIKVLHPESMDPGTGTRRPRKVRSR